MENGLHGFVLGNILDETICYLEADKVMDICEISTIHGYHYRARVKTYINSDGFP